MRLGLCGLIFAGLTAFAAIACAQPAASSTSSPAANGSGSFPSRVLRQTTFNIPFTVETARQPLEVQLYLSRDRGQTWKLYARQNPSARFFPFHATEDGEYWFASQTIDATRAPAEMAGRQPELHVVIDTVQPQFQFQASLGAAREIQVSWHCSDPSIDPSSLKIEYQTGREQPWQPVRALGSASGTVSGSTTFVPRTAWVELQVRAEISDLARNKAVVTRRLTLPEAGLRASNQGQTRWQPTRDPSRPVALPPTKPDPSELVTSATNQGSLPPNPNGYERGGFGSLPIGLGPAKPSSVPFDSGVPADPYANVRPVESNNTPNRQTTTNPSPGGVTDSAPSTEWKPAGRTSDYQETLPSGDALHELASDSRYQPQPSHVQPLVSQQITAAGPNDDPTARPDLNATLPSAMRPDSNRLAALPLRMTSAMRFELDYEFDAAAANGVRSVELWGTRDQGQTWSRWQVDADRQSPLDVQVDAEGTYGFRIVIVGNNGLAGDAPRNGDDADLWVGVDTTAPVVRITTATYGEGEHAGQLAIRWTADDASFGENPISIFFSDKVTGPWTTIAAGVPDAGQYFWPIDPRVPEQLYLRIEARDRAGNLGEYRLPEPVNLAGFTPKARIRGIRPLTNAPLSDSSDLETSPQATRNPSVYR